ncbi:MAG: zinc ABC transporter ATP-binding protein, partial [Tissierellia bacterium]|nr:zinc ABC transporter ATP-binding protein [Tissierellia bacterium]
MNYLEMKNISLIRDEIKILNNINLKIDKGDFLSVIGSSGSGKST